MTIERDYIKCCIRQIEERFQLGEGSAWKQRDMQYLSNLIEERSGTLLSLSTIKRLLKNEDQHPQPATLNALVSVLDYDDWQHFKIDNPILNNGNSKKKGTPVLLFVASGLAIVISGWFLISGFGTTAEESNVSINGPVIFDANKTLISGVPNTVVFNYDLKNVEADSFFIQQSWNELEKTPVPQNGEFHTSMYYYPGFHRAKLIANDSIIRRKFIHITTDGWFPLVRYDFEEAVPVYIKDFQIEENALSIKSSDLENNGVDMKRDFYLTCFNVKEYDGIHSDNFEFSTRVKADSVRNLACPFIDVVIMTEQHIFYTHLIQKGCESMISLKMGEVILSGKENDLSAFGRDVYQWQDLSINVENKIAGIYLNGEKVRSVPFEDDFGKIVGMGISFSGIGSIAYADFRNTGDKIVANR